MTIKTGDLCMVVRPKLCCGSVINMGKVFIVAGIDSTMNEWCPICKYRSNGAVTTADAGGDKHFRFERLIKIDPPAIPETTEREQEETT